MSYRLINANALNGVISDDDYEKVLKAPCIFADLPNGLDGKHYNLQEPKTGHWIRMKAYGKWKCPECSTVFRFTFKEHYYCPNCGAKMVEPQESEDKDADSN